MLPSTATAPVCCLTLLLAVWCVQYTPVSGLEGSVFEDLLQHLADNDLGVTQLQTYLNNEVNFVSSPLDGSTLVQRLAESLEAKFQERIEVVESLKEGIEAEYGSFTSDTSFPTCCHGQLQEEDMRFKAHVNLNDVCMSGEQIPSATKFVNEKVRDLMRENLRRYPTIRWQYFGSEEGVMTTYPSFRHCDEDYDPRFRPFYVTTTTPKPKDVVVVIDTSGSMTTTVGNDNRMNIAIEAANTVISTLGPNDRVGVVAFQTDPSTPLGNRDTSSCYSTVLAKATPINKGYLIDYVSNLRAMGGTEYGKAFRVAFEMMGNTGEDEFDTRIRDKVLLFLTDGVPYDDKVDILATIRTENAKLGNKVVILTYGIGEALDALPREILESIAQQEDYDATAGEIQVGEFTAVADGNDLRRIMGSYYNYFSKTGQIPEATFVVPYYDAFGLGLVTSACLPVYYNTKLVGATCVDMTMSDLLSDVTYFKEGELSYAFLIDGQARLLMHPLLPQPYAVEEDPIYVNMLSLETFSGAEDVMDSMLLRQPGSKSVSSQRVTSRGSAVYEGVKTTDVMTTYFWHPVEGTEFSVCLVIADEDKQATVQWSGGYDEEFIYHRLDLKRPSFATVCNSFGRLAVKDHSTVGFSPEAFVDPYVYLSTEETSSTVDSYEVYMTGGSNTNPSPGFKDGVRETVAVTAQFDEVMDSLGWAEYVVWRYIGTHDGVFRVLPGSSQDKDYDHTQRSWYQRSMSEKGMLTLSTPYWDALGAGYVLTLSKTLMEGSSDLTIGVMGMDFTLRYIYYLLTSSYPECLEDSNTCFIIERSGFIVVHEDSAVLEGTDEADIENIHITVKEPYIAADLIKRNVMTKSACVNFETIKDQTFWSVSIRSGRKLIATDYEIHEVQNTNVFLVMKKYKGVKQSDCSCPSYSLEFFSGLGTCRRAIDECECPCSEKTDIYEYCRDNFNLISDSWPPCTPRIPPLDLESARPGEREQAAALEQCFDYSCSTKDEEESCNWSASCSWCITGENGDALETPYCDEREICPVGGKEKGGEGDDGGNRAAIIGGVFALILLVIIVIVAVLIYRYKRRRTKPDPNAPPPPSARAVNTHQGHDNPAMQHQQPPQTPPPTYPAAVPLENVYQSIDPPPAYGNAPYMTMTGNSPPAYPPPNPYNNTANPETYPYNAYLAPQSHKV